MFKKIKISKCDHCIIGEKEKKGEIKLLERNIGELRRGKETAKVLIVLSRYETDKFISFFETLLKKYHIDDYVIVSGIDCSISNMKGYTKHDLYKYCNAVDLEKFKNLKVIITIGSGLLAITKTSDIEGWYEFKEFVFNQTYFYTGFNCERKIRVYPLPYLDEIIISDSFERFFAEKQLEFIKNELGIKKEKLTIYEKLPYTFIDEFNKNKNNFISIKISDEEVHKIKEFVSKVVKEKEGEAHHKSDSEYEYNRFYSGFLGEVAIEKLLNKKFIDWSIGNSFKYRIADLSIIGLNIGVKTCAYNSFPIIHKSVKRAEIINIKMSDNEIIVCGYASKKVLSSYQDDNIKWGMLKNKESKTGFYGLSKLIPFKTFEDLQKLEEYNNDNL